ncbi:glycoside hydrolase superfamily [Biscogniauxia mediterranea]|nr:glycoside hydrolase superfamily [Biscogniauxia mediterranea]
MMLTRVFLMIAILAVSALAAYTRDFKLNTYWGQSGYGDTLGQYCTLEGIDYVTLAFVNNSPEHGDGTDYPGTNFASHCAADVYVKGDRYSKLLRGCSSIVDDIKTCQDLGKKVLLSIGGVYTAANDYSISSVEKGQEFADFMFDAFGPFVDGYRGPRPFDKSETDHTCIDGFDFDIEYMFEDQEPYVAMAKRLRERIEHCDKDIILTAAPQCPLSDEYFQMKSMLQQVQFDKIWIQFYNNPSCDATSSELNYNDWVHFLEDTPNKDAELYVGLAASPLATTDGSGYVAPDAVQALICDHKKQLNFGGVMLWDANYAVENINSGKSYCESVAEALRCGGCPDDLCVPGQPGSSPIASASTSVPQASSPITGSSTSPTIGDTSRTLHPSPTSSEENDAGSADDQGTSYASVPSTTTATSTSTPFPKTTPTHIAPHVPTETALSSRIPYAVTAIFPETVPISIIPGSQAVGQGHSDNTDYEGSSSTPGPDLPTSRSTTRSIHDVESTTTSSYTSRVACSSTGADCTDVTIVRTVPVYPVAGTSSSGSSTGTSAPTSRVPSQAVFETVAVAGGEATSCPLARRGDGGVRA